MSRDSSIREPWFCDRALILPSCPRFHVSARLRVCSSRALSRLRALFHVGAWCLDPGTHVLSFGHVTGFGHSRSIFCHCVSARSRVRSAPRTLVHVGFVVLHAVRVSIGFVHLCCILCCVAHVLFCTWLVICLLAMCLCFCFVCEHVASVLVFCVPRALMSICLDPTHLVTCLLIHFPQLFSLVTLIICSL